MPIGPPVRKRRRSLEARRVAASTKAESTISSDLYERIVEVCGWND